MHVLYFHQHFSTPKGAAGIRSYKMARALLQAGHSVTMVCGSYGSGKTGLDGPFKRGRREGVVEGFRIIEFDLAYSNADNFIKRGSTFLKFALRSIALALTERYDIIFATTTPLTAGIPGIIARWVRGKPFVFEVRDLWPELPRAMGVITNPIVLGLMSALEWVSYRSAHRCVALSPGILEGIARSGVPSERIALIPNGCDIEIFIDANIIPWRPADVGNDDIMAVFAGTHGIANGLDNILDAAHVLRQRGRDDIRIVLIGDGKLKPGLVERAKLEKLDNIIFHAPVDKTALAGLLSAADIGIQCLSNVEAFYQGTSPNKFFDYISSGLPVLNNYPGWIAELIENYQFGFVVPPDNPLALADALECAANGRAALNQMSANATRLAQTEFSRDMLAKRWVAWVVEGQSMPPAFPAKKLSGNRAVH